jgi:hypothetical protein
MPKVRKLPKLTPDQHRALVEEYNISFDGPIFPSRWPAQYEHIFQKIRDIQCLRFDEYRPEGTMEIPTVSEMKNRVLELTDIAHDCRRRRENEATWRAHTEPMIVSRFDAEAVWLVSSPHCRCISTGGTDHAQQFYMQRTTLDIEVSGLAK